MPKTARPELVRAIGRWSLAALMVNAIIGSGVFGLPSDIAKLVGRSSPWAMLAGGATIAVIIACFAEVASQFTQTGGPYLYARVAFGRLVGIEMGWMFWLVRITAPAANANLFVIYLAQFWPRAQEPWPRFLVLTVLIGLLALINFLGVRGGVRVSNTFTIAKLVPLFAVGIAGAVYLLAGHKVATMAAPGGDVHSWLKAILLLMFAYGGFESALTPMNEAKDPRRDSVFALFAALATCILLYTSVQWAVVGILPDPASSQRPVADVAGILFGKFGATLAAVGALVSVYGYLSANMLAVPRITFALAEQGDFPPIFSAIHPRFRTPYFSILVFALLTWILAFIGSFSWNVTLSAVARLLFYGVGCAALPVLRKKQPTAALFRVPGGLFLPVLGVVICLVLLTQVNLGQSVILVATIVLALANWAWVRWRPADSPQ